MWFTGKSVTPNEKCQVDPKFAEDSFQPGMDGVFNLTVIQAPLEFEKLHSLRIDFTGSRVNKLGRRRKGLRKKGGKRRLIIKWQ